MLTRIKYIFFCCKKKFIWEENLCYLQQKQQIKSLCGKTANKMFAHNTQKQQIKWFNFNNQMSHTHVLDFEQILYFSSSLLSKILTPPSLSIPIRCKKTYDWQRPNLKHFCIIFGDYLCWFKISQRYKKIHIMKKSVIHLKIYLKTKFEKCENPFLKTCFRSRINLSVFSWFTASSSLLYCIYFDIVCDFVYAVIRINIYIARGLRSICALFWLI